MNDIRIGIIGHGFMGHEHEKMLTNMDGIRVIGIADIDPRLPAPSAWCRIHSRCSGGCCSQTG